MVIECRTWLLLFTIGKFAASQTTPLPSSVPTLAPSSTRPTFSPSFIPSFLPTLSPTIEATSVPTSLPTRRPTHLPTILPSIRPTGTPSLPPSPNPTALPTSLPSAQPTHAPSSLPTARPSRRPTPPPTRLPTPPPSQTPTTIPTPIPFPLPTPSPTLIPFPVPTPIPFPLPTQTPTPPPSQTPTVIPTPPPTKIPSIMPTPPPTHIPSPIPTASPKEEIPVIVLSSAASVLVFLIILALIEKRTRCCSGVKEESDDNFEIGDQVKWWSDDEDIPKGAIGEILRFNADNTKVFVQFETGTFELGVTTISKVQQKSNNRWKGGISGWDDDKDDNDQAKKDKAKLFKVKVVEGANEEVKTVKTKKQQPWMPKNNAHLDDEEENQQKPSFVEKKRLKSVRIFMDFLSRGNLEEFAPFIADLGYLDVPSFLDEVDQSADDELMVLLNMTSTQIASLRKLASTTDRKSGLDAAVAVKKPEHLSRVGERLDRSFRQLDRSLSFTSNNNNRKKSGVGKDRSLSFSQNARSLSFENFEFSSLAPDTTVFDELVRPSSIAREEEASTPSRGGSKVRNRSTSNARGGNPSEARKRSTSNARTLTDEGLKSPTGAGGSLRRTNSRSRNDNNRRSISREPPSPQIEQSSMSSFNIFGTGISNSEEPITPRRKQSSFDEPRSSKSTRRSSRSNTTDLNSPMNMAIDETASTTVFPSLSLLTSPTASATSTAEERSDGLRSSFTDFFGGDTPSNVAAAKEETETNKPTKAGKSQQKALSPVAGAGASLVAEGKPDRPRPGTIETKEVPKRLSTLQRHQQKLQMSSPRSAEQRLQLSSPRSAGDEFRNMGTSI